MQYFSFMSMSPLWFTCRWLVLILINNVMILITSIRILYIMRISVMVLTTAVMIFRILFNLFLNHESDSTFDFDCSLDLDLIRSTSRMTRCTRCWLSALPFIRSALTKQSTPICARNTEIVWSRCRKGQSRFTLIPFSSFCKNSFINFLTSLKCLLDSFPSNFVCISFIQNPHWIQFSQYSYWILKCLLDSFPVSFSCIFFLYCIYGFLNSKFTLNSISSLFLLDFCTLNPHECAY